MNQIEKIFNEVCATYFPRWRSAKRWTVKQASRLANSREYGMCLRAEKTILVNVPVGNDEFMPTLVHEICHAVTRCNHRKEWLARMALARQRADQLGNADLAARLAFQIDGYSKHRREASFEVLISDDLEMSAMVGVPLDDVLVAIGNDYAMTREEIYQVCPDVESIYKEFLP